MTPQTGDMILYAPKPGRANFAQRGIQAYGSVSTHGEMAKVDVHRKVWGGCAHKPYFELLLTDGRGGDWAVYRWHLFCRPEHHHTAYYRTYRECVGSMLRLGHEMRWPYDSRAIKWITYNYVNRLFWRWGGKSYHVEHAVYCIESMDLITRACQVDIFQPVRPQKHLAPVHCERLVSSQHWVLIEDHNLHNRILGMQR